MILIKQFETTDKYSTSTRDYEDDLFQFIATNTVSSKNIELLLTRDEATPRFDKFEINISNIQSELGLYDYVILTKDFNYLYSTVTNIINQYPEYVVETGKMMIVDKYGKHPQTTHEGSSPERVTYKG